MVMKLLDTTFLIDILKGKPETTAILHGQDPLLTTQINMYEIITGLFFKNLPPSKILQVRELFEDVRVLPLDERAIVKAAEICAELMKKGEMIEDCDCLIAGIALSNGVSAIVTKNIKHFERIKGIKVERY